MGRSPVEIFYEYPDLGSVWDTDRVNRFIAAQLQFQRGMIFANEGQYNGRDRWKGLQWRNGMILSDRGDLRRSVAPKNDGIVPSTGEGTILKVLGDMVEVGSSLIYARIHDQGGKIVAKNGKALKIPLPEGEKATGPKGSQAPGTFLKEFADNRKTPEWSRALGVQGGKKGNAAYAKFLLAAIEASKGSQRRRMKKRLSRLVNSPIDQKFIFRRSVTIPKRSYLDWTDGDAAELNEALGGFLKKLISEAKRKRRTT